MTNDDFPDPAERLRAFAQLLAGGQQNGDQNTPADENTMNVMAELFNNPDYQRLMMAQSMPSTPQTPVQHSMAPAAANPENPAFRALVGLHNAQAAGFPLGVYPNMEMTEAMRHAPFGVPFFSPYMDPSRRKNATREATKPLKQWLAAHRKSPYPNKGDKMMLTIMTGMTLTQVSTWFANARRRLKKENKMTWSPRNSRPEDDEDDDEGPLNHSHEPHSPSISVHSDEFKHDTSNLSSEEKKNEGTPKRKIWSITETLQQQASTNSSPDDSKSVRTVSPPSSSSSSDNNQTTATPSVPPMAASQVFPGFPGMPFFAPNPAMMNAMNPMALFAAMQQQTASMRMNPLQNLLFNQQFNQLGRNAVPNPEINPITLLQNMMKAENASGSNSKNEVKAESTGEREARSSCNSSAEPNSPLFGNCALKEEERSTSAGVTEQPA